MFAAKTAATPPPPQMLRALKNRLFDNLANLFIFEKDVIIIFSLERSNVTSVTAHKANLAIEQH